MGGWFAIIIAFIYWELRAIKTKKYPTFTRLTDRALERKATKGCLLIFWVWVWKHFFIDYKRRVGGAVDKSNSSW